MSNNTESHGIIELCIQVRIRLGRLSFELESLTQKGRDDLTETQQQL